MKHLLDLDGLCYGLVWQRDEDSITVSTAFGRHDFAKFSKSFEFKDGEGYVGHLFSSISDEPIVISNLASLSPLEFLRKPNALLSGIHSLLFMRIPTGLLELGFCYPDAALLASKNPLLQRWLPTRTFDPLFLPLPSKCLAKCKSFRDEQHHSDNFSDIDSLRQQQVASPLQSSSIQVSLPSKGSYGHPHCCQAPCRYWSTPRGCKDGEKCVRCHLCQFTRAMHRAKRDYPTGTTKEEVSEQTFASDIRNNAFQHSSSTDRDRLTGSQDVTADEPPCSTARAGCNRFLSFPLKVQLSEVSSEFRNSALKGSAIAV